jgi:hypothetical protein
LRKINEYRSEGENHLILYKDSRISGFGKAMWIVGKGFAELMKSADTAVASYNTAFPQLCQYESGMALRECLNVIRNGLGDYNLGLNY